VGISHLAQLRKKSRLTQSQLAQKLGLPVAYGQKKVSQWEAGLTKPSEEELARLAKVMKVSIDEIALYVAEPGGQSSLELGVRLAASDRPALFAICYTGRPRIMSDSFVRARFVEAMKRTLSMAMFVPFPMAAPSSQSSARMLLAGYYSRVWGSVLDVRDRLQAEVGHDRNIGLYGPSQNTIGEPWFTPPFGSRYALLVQKNAQGDADKSLYITLETAQNKSLQLIGTASDDATFEEIQSWEAFFNPVITAWMTDNSLPHHDCGTWQYMHEPSRAAAVTKGQAKKPRKP
jgi:transcriptional regulator with XRE-family HTH domain